MRTYRFRTSSGSVPTRAGRFAEGLLAVLYGRDSWPLVVCPTMAQHHALIRSFPLLWDGREWGKQTKHNLWAEIKLFPETGQRQAVTYVCMSVCSSWCTRSCSPPPAMPSSPPAVSHPLPDSFHWCHVGWNTLWPP